MGNKHDKIISVLENFLEQWDVEGICGFFIDKELDEHDNIWVYVILNIDWVQSIQTKPEFVANRMRNGVKESIKNFTGIEVMVGSMAKKCNE